MSKYKVSEKYALSSSTDTIEGKFNKKNRRKSSSSKNDKLSLRNRSLSLGSLTSPQMFGVEISVTDTVDAPRSPEPPSSAPPRAVFNDMEYLQPVQGAHLLSKRCFLTFDNMYGHKVGSISSSTRSVNTTVKTSTGILHRV